MKPRRIVSSSETRKLPGEIQRQRLLRQLSGKACQVVALLAPSGYGKTTLLAQHLSSEPQPYVWVTLSEDHRDYRQLVASLVSELQSNTGGEPLELSQFELLQSTPSGAARLLAQYLNALDFNLGLVFDRIEHLTGESNTFVSKLIDRLGEGHQVFLAGYSADGLPLATWQTQERLLELGAEDLAFNLEETTAFLQQRHFEGDVAGAYTAQEGWPAGIALVAAGARTHLKTHDLVREVLDRLPPELRRALPEAAVVEEWSEANLQDLGVHLPVGWLKTALSVGLPIAPLGAGQYRPHKILLDALEAELRPNPKRHATLHKAAAKQAKRRGHNFGALRHLIVAKAKEEALKLAEQMARHYLERWEYAMARQVLEQFDLADLPPLLQAVLGHCMVETRALVQGETLLHSLADDGEVAAMAYNSLARIAGFRGNHALQLELIEKSLELSQHTWYWGYQLSTYTWTLGELERFEDSIRVLKELVAWGERTNQPLDVGRAMSQLAATYTVMGRFQDAEQTNRRSIRIFEELGFAVRTLNIKSNLAFGLMVQGRMDEAKTLLDQAIPIATQEGHVFEILLRENLGEWHLLRGEYSQTLEALTQALWLCGGRPLDAKAQDLRLQICNVARMLNRDDLVRHHLGRAREVAKRTDRPSSTILFRFHEGLEAFYGGHLEEADQRLQLVKESMEAALAPRALAYRAEIARRLGHLDRTLVEEWLGSLDKLGGDQVLRIDAPILQELYRTCVQKGWFAERFEPWLDVPPLDSEQTQGAVGEKKLELQLMGKPEVSYSGEPVHIPLSKSLELLAWLALRGPASREELINALWNGLAEYEDGRYLKVALRRLRMALREAMAVEFDPIPYQHGLYKISPSLNIKVDASLILQALHSTEESPLYTALAAYKGPFMKGFATEWVDETRQTLRDAATAAVLRLGKTLEEENPTSAIEVYRRGVEIDPASALLMDVLGEVYTRLNDKVGQQWVQRLKERAFH